MKLITSTLALMFLAATLTAQISKTDSTKQTIRDTSYLKVGGKQIIIIEERNGNEKDFFTDNEHHSKNVSIDLSWNKKFDGHYAGVEFGLNNYLNKDFEMLVPENGKYMELDDSKSIEFNLNIVDVSLPIVKNRLGLVTGMGLGWNNYKFDNKQLILQNGGDSLFVLEDTITQYSKNKLNALYLNVPLMIEFQQSVGGKKLWVAVGVYGGLKLGSHTKLVTNDGEKTKTRKDFHLNTLRYGLRAQVGFDDFGVYCNYSLASLFKKDQGPELYPLSLGVSLAF